MELSTVDLVGALVDAEPGWERVALGLQLDGTVFDLAGLLDAIDPATLDGDELVSYLRLTERITAKVAAVAQRTIALVADRTEALGLHPEDARHELAAALRLSPLTASQRVQVALELRDRFSATLALMDAGRIGYQHAAHLVRETEGLDDDTAAAVQARVLRVMGELTAAVPAAPPGTPWSRSTLRRHLSGRRSSTPTGASSGSRTATAAPAGACPCQPTSKPRCGRRSPPPPGPSRPRGSPPASTTPASTRFGSTSPSTGSSAAPPQQASPSPTNRPASSPPPRDAGRQVSRGLPRCTCGGAQTAAVVLDIRTALGLADNPGYPCPATARSLPTSPAGWPPTATGSAGSPTRRPGSCSTAALDATDLAEPCTPTSTPGDQVCGFPGCNQAARACDCDHVVAFRHHGQSVQINLGALCRQHHNAKTHGHWRLHYDPHTATKTWTSPLGLIHTKTRLPLLT